MCVWSREKNIRTARRTNEQDNIEHDTDKIAATTLHLKIGFIEENKQQYTHHTRTKSTLIAHRSCVRAHHSFHILDCDSMRDSPLCFHLGLHLMSSVRSSVGRCKVSAAAVIWSTDRRLSRKTTAIFISSLAFILAFFFEWVQKHQTIYITIYIYIYIRFWKLMKEHKSDNITQFTHKKR